VLNSNVLLKILEMTLNDPSNFDCTLFEGSGLDGVNVDSLPSSIVEDKPYAVDEGYLNACYKFVTLWILSLALDHLIVRGLG